MEIISPKANSSSLDQVVAEPFAWIATPPTLRSLAVCDLETHGRFESCREDARPYLFSTAAFAQFRGASNYPNAVRTGDSIRSESALVRVTLTTNTLASPPPPGLRTPSRGSSRVRDPLSRSRAAPSRRSGRARPRMRRSSRAGRRKCLRARVPAARTRPRSASSGRTGRRTSIPSLRAL